MKAGLVVETCDLLTVFTVCFCIRVVSPDQMQLNFPTALAVDSQRKCLYICEFGNRRVTAVSISDRWMGEVELIVFVCLASFTTLRDVSGAVR